MTNLQELKKQIETMSKHHQTEVLRILSKNQNVCLNENNNGTFVNLTEQSEDVINKLIEYTKYVAEQQTRLMDIEEEKDRLENTFFKDNKDSNSIITH